MFYIQPIAEHTRQKWDAIAQIDRLPVLQPAPHKGLWQVNAAALNPWSLRSIAAHLARKSKMPRESWVQATSRILAEIIDGFTVNAEEWELVQTPELQDSGVFFVPTAGTDKSSYGRGTRQFHLCQLRAIKKAGFPASRFTLQTSPTPSPSTPAHSRPQSAPAPALGA